MDIIPFDGSDDLEPRSTYWRVLTMEIDPNEWQEDPDYVAAGCPDNYTAPDYDPNEDGE